MSTPIAHAHAPEVQAALTRLSAVIERALARTITDNKKAAGSPPAARVAGGHAGGTSTSSISTT